MIGMVHERRKEYRLSYTIAKVEGGQRSGVRIIGTVQLKWNNTLRAGATVGTNPRGSQSSDGVTDRTKKRNKGDLGVAQNKELSTGKRTGSKLVWNESSE